MCIQDDLAPLYSPLWAKRYTMTSKSEGGIRVPEIIEAESSEQLWISWAYSVYKGLRRVNSMRLSVVFASFRGAEASTTDDNEGKAPLACVRML